VYDPAARLESSTTTLGPIVLTDEPPGLTTANVSELHFEKESRASARPAPTVTVKVRLGLAGFSAPEKTSVCVVATGPGDGDGVGDGIGLGDGLGDGDADGLGADPTGAEIAEMAVVEPTPFATVTAIRKPKPESVACTVYFAAVAATLQTAFGAQRCHWTFIKLIGAEPVQLPWPRSNTWPTWGAAASGW